MQYLWGTAIVKMVQDGCRQIKEVYVVTNLTGEEVTAPCGFCRQFIRQFSHDDVCIFAKQNKLLIHLGSVKKGHEQTITLRHLLPFQPWAQNRPMIYLHSNSNIIPFLHLLHLFLKYLHSFPSSFKNKYFIYLRFLFILPSFLLDYSLLSLSSPS